MSNTLFNLAATKMAEIFELQVAENPILAKNKYMYECICQFGGFDASVSGDEIFKNWNTNSDETKQWIASAKQTFIMWKWGAYHGDFDAYNVKNVYSYFQELWFGGHLSPTMCDRHLISYINI